MSKRISRNSSAQSPERGRLQYVRLVDINPSAENARKHDNAQIRAIAKSIEAFGFNAPILIRKNGQIVAGHGRYQAAKLLGLTQVPVIPLEHLSEVQARAYMLADNKLTDRSSWDDNKVAIQLKELSELALDFEIEAIGFELPEIDFRIQSLDVDDSADTADEFNAAIGSAVTVVGDLWHLGPHRVLCGNSTDIASYATVMQDDMAAGVFTDPPYNCKIDGHVGGKGSIKHREFAMAAGEMSEQEFTDFLASCLNQIGRHTVPGAIIYACMDWRHMEEILTAGRTAHFELLNLCVWAKSNGGMGSLYRSRHELVFVFRNGSHPHQNNVQLGRFGRNRTNVWNYPGVGSFARSGPRLLELHPTVKPIALVSDAILDSTKRGDIVLDPFLGSGTTLLAAERTGRQCRGIEIDPLYVDTAIARWQRLSHQEAMATDGRTFAAVRATRVVI